MTEKYWKTAFLLKEPSGGFRVSGQEGSELTMKVGPAEKDALSALILLLVLPGGGGDNGLLAAPFSAFPLESWRASLS